jgi:hypothetical protein
LFEPQSYPFLDKLYLYPFLDKPYPYPFLNRTLTRFRQVLGIRFGVMQVGPTGGGKTTIALCMAEVSSPLHQQPKKNPQPETRNPEPANRNQKKQKTRKYETRNQNTKTRNTNHETQNPEPST